MALITNIFMDLDYILNYCIFNDGQKQCYTMCDTYGSFCPIHKKYVMTGKISEGECHENEVFFCAKKIIELAGTVKRKKGIKQKAPFLESLFSFILKNIRFLKYYDSIEASMLHKLNKYKNMKWISKNLHIFNPHIYIDIFDDISSDKQKNNVCSYFEINPYPERCSQKKKDDSYFCENHKPEDEVQELLMHEKYSNEELSYLDYLIHDSMSLKNKLDDEIIDNNDYIEHHPNSEDTFCFTADMIYYLSSFNYKLSCMIIPPEIGLSFSSYHKNRCKGCENKCNKKNNFDPAKYLMHFFTCSSYFENFLIEDRLFLKSHLMNSGKFAIKNREIGYLIKTV